MKKQKSIFANYSKWIFICSLFCFGSTSLLAQTSVSNRLADVTIPSNTTKLYIDLKGGDGGNAEIQGDCKASGGAGATVKALFEVGTGSNQVPPGSTLRFIKGEKGGSESSRAVFGAGTAGGAGGGGSAVLYRKPGDSADDDWKILAVAGGGGGAYTGMFSFACIDKDSGRGGQDISDGGDGKDSDNRASEGGQNGQEGKSIKHITGHGSGGGAGAYGEPDLYNAKKGYPAGGAGGRVTDGQDGGWGFGGGGASYYGPGGGGGYSGGGAGDINYAGGGGSYLSGKTTPMLSYISKGSDGGGKKEDGYIKYQFNPTESLYASLEEKTIYRSANWNKCIDLDGEITTNGTNIQLYNCNDEVAQKWVFDNNLYIRYANNRNKCISLAGGDFRDGDNIHIWDCKNQTNQQWFYDVNNRFIRSSLNPNKCIDDVNGSSNNGTNIQLYECVYGNHKTNMQWKVTGLPSSMPTGGNLRIQLIKDRNKCVDIQSAAAKNYTNIQLYNCHTSNASQYFIFDGEQIKMQANTKFCVDVDRSQTSNGTKIQLYECNKTNAQKWIYDASGKTFRSKLNLKKCLSIKDGDAHSGTDIHLWDCRPNDNQQFDILVPPPCEVDTTPPVARCKDAHFSNFSAPTVSDINNGSTDNCEIESLSIQKVSGNTYKLIVTDKSNNSSSCTANVTTN